MKRNGIAWGIVVALAAVCAALAWAWWPAALPATAELPFDSPKAAVAPVGDSLRLMTWNLHGLRKPRAPTDDALVDINAAAANLSLEDVVGAIGRIQPDVLFLQGVDRAAKRSGDVDQVAGLKRGLKAYPHVACAPLVEASGPFGVGESGLCVFSKYRIIRHQRVLEKAVATFDLVDGAQILEVAIGRHRYRILNVALFSTSSTGAWMRDFVAEKVETTTAQEKKEADRPALLAVAVGGPSLPTAALAPLVDVMEELSPAKSATWPAAAPAERREAIYLAPKAPLLDMRVALEAGEVAAELPVVVNLQLKVDPPSR